MAFTSYETLKTTIIMNMFLHLNQINIICMQCACGELHNVL